MGKRITIQTDKVGIDRVLGIIGATLIKCCLVL